MVGSTALEGVPSYFTDLDGDGFAGEYLGYADGTELLAVYFFDPDRSGEVIRTVISSISPYSYLEWLEWVDLDLDGRLAETIVSVNKSVQAVFFDRDGSVSKVTALGTTRGNNMLQFGTAQLSSSEVWIGVGSDSGNDDDSDDVIKGLQLWKVSLPELEVASIVQSSLDVNWVSSFVDFNQDGIMSESLVPADFVIRESFYTPMGLDLISWDGEKFTTIAKYRGGTGVWPPTVGIWFIESFATIEFEGEEAIAFNGLIDWFFFIGAIRPSLSLVLFAPIPDVGGSVLVASYLVSNTSFSLVSSILELSLAGFQCLPGYTNSSGTCQRCEERTVSDGRSPCSACLNTDDDYEPSSGYPWLPSRSMCLSCFYPYTIYIEASNSCGQCPPGQFPSSYSHSLCQSCKSSEYTSIVPGNFSFFGNFSFSGEWCNTCLGGMIPEHSKYGVDDCVIPAAFDDIELKTSGIILGILGLMILVYCIRGRWFLSASSNGKVEYTAEQLSSTSENGVGGRASRVLQMTRSLDDAIPLDEIQSDISSLLTLPTPRQCVVAQSILFHAKNATHSTASDATRILVDASTTITESDSESTPLVSLAASSLLYAIVEIATRFPDQVESNMHPMLSMVATFLSDEDVEVREAASSAMQACVSAASGMEMDVTPAISPRLSDASTHVRSQMARSLHGYLVQQSAPFQLPQKARDGLVFTLEGIMSTDEDGVCRRYAVSCLGELCRLDAVPKSMRGLIKEGVLECVSEDLDGEVVEEAEKVLSVLNETKEKSVWLHYLELGSTFFVSVNALWNFISDVLVLQTVSEDAWGDSRFGYQFKYLHQGWFRLFATVMIFALTLTILYNIYVIIVARRMAASAQETRRATEDFGGPRIRSRGHENTATTSSNNRWGTRLGTGLAWFLSAFSPELMLKPLFADAMLGSSKDPRVAVYIQSTVWVSSALEDFPSLVQISIIALAQPLSPLRVASLVSTLLSLVLRLFRSLVNGSVMSNFETKLVSFTRGRRYVLESREGERSVLRPLSGDISYFVSNIRRHWSRALGVMGLTVVLTAPYVAASDLFIGNWDLTYHIHHFLFSVTSFRIYFFLSLCGLAVIKLIILHLFFRYSKFTASFAAQVVSHGVFSGFLSLLAVLFGLPILSILFGEANGILSRLARSEFFCICLLGSSIAIFIQPADWATAKLVVRDVNWIAYCVAGFGLSGIVITSFLDTPTSFLSFFTSLVIPSIDLKPTTSPYVSSNRWCCTCCGGSRNSTSASTIASNPLLSPVSQTTPEFLRFRGPSILAEVEMGENRESLTSSLLDNSH